MIESSNYGDKLMQKIDQREFYRNSQHVKEVTAYLAENIDQADEFLPNWYKQFHAFQGRDNEAYAFTLMAKMFVKPDIGPAFGRDGFIDQSKKLFTEFGKAYWEDKNAYKYAADMLIDPTTEDVIGSDGVVELAKFVTDEVVAKKDLEYTGNAARSLQRVAQHAISNAWGFEQVDALERNVSRLNKYERKLEKSTQRQKPSLYNLVDDLFPTPDDRAHFYGEQLHHIATITDNKTRENKFKIVRNHLVQPDTLQQLHTGKTEFNDNAADLLQQQFIITFNDPSVLISSHSVKDTLVVLHHPAVRENFGPYNLAETLELMTNSVMAGKPSGQKKYETQIIQDFLEQKNIANALSDEQCDGIRLRLKVATP